MRLSTHPLQPRAGQGCRSISLDKLQAASQSGKGNALGEAGRAEPHLCSSQGHSDPSVRAVGRPVGLLETGLGNEGDRVVELSLVNRGSSLGPPHCPSRGRHMGPAAWQPWAHFALGPNFLVRR